MKTVVGCTGRSENHIDQEQARPALCHNLGDDLAGRADGHRIQFDFRKFLAKRFPDHRQIADRVGRVNRDLAFFLRRSDDLLPTLLPGSPRIGRYDETCSPQRKEREKKNDRPKFFASSERHKYRLFTPCLSLAPNLFSSPLHTPTRPKPRHHIHLGVAKHTNARCTAWDGYLFGHNVAEFHNSIPFGNYCARIFFIRSTTSGGCSITSLAILASSSPPTGVISSLFCFASSSNAGSLMLFMKASRKSFTRSAGSAGDATIGRPSSPEPNITVATRRPRSGVLNSSISSLSSGTSGNCGSLLRPVCKRTRTKFVLRHV